jgi:hypothetical protein
MCAAQILRFGVIRSVRAFVELYEAFAPSHPGGCWIFVFDHFCTRSFRLNAILGVSCRKKNAIGVIYLSVRLIRIIGIKSIRYRKHGPRYAPRRSESGNLPCLDYYDVRLRYSSLTEEFCSTVDCSRFWVG